MKKMMIIILSFTLLGCNGQIKPAKNIVSDIPQRKTKLSKEQIKKLDSINIDFQLRGNCYAFSSNKNARESNGEAHSDNLPKTVDENFPKQDFYLLINQNELTTINGKFLGTKLYLVNTTDSLIDLNASDSRLNIVAEVLNEKKEWITITYLPSSGCGNSYHIISLDKNEYWEFDIPVFKGSHKTKLRYTLAYQKEKKISSNEIDADINIGQLDKQNKQGHSPTNLMDPYSE